MNPRSILAVGLAATLLLVIAAVSPAAPLQLFLSAVAALCALVSLAFGSGKWRIIGLVVMILGLAMAARAWPQARKHMQDYRTPRKAGPYHHSTSVYLQEEGQVADKAFEKRHAQTVKP